MIPKRCRVTALWIPGDCGQAPPLFFRPETLRFCASCSELVSVPELAGPVCRVRHLKCVCERGKERPRYRLCLFSVISDDHPSACRPRPCPLTSPPSLLAPDLLHSSNAGLGLSKRVSTSGPLQMPFASAREALSADIFVTCPTHLLHQAFLPLENFSEHYVS